MTLERLVILNEVKDLWQNDPLPKARRALTKCLDNVLLPADKIHQTL